MIHFVAEADKGRQINLFVEEVVAWLQLTGQESIECIFNDTRFTVHAVDAVSASVDRWNQNREVNFKLRAQIEANDFPETLYFGKHPGLVRVYQRAR